MTTHRIAPTLTATVNGRDFDVAVDSDGTFCALLDGEPFRADTLAKLRDKLKQHMAAHNTVNIPATIVSEGWRREGKVEIEHVVLTGINSANNNITYKRGDHKGGGQCSGRGDGLCRRLTPAEEAGLRAAYQEQWRAEQAYRRLKESYQMDGKAEVEKAAYIGSPSPAETPARKGKR